MPTYYLIHQIPRHIIFACTKIVFRLLIPLPVAPETKAYMFLTQRLERGMVVDGKKMYY